MTDIADAVAQLARNAAEHAATGLAVPYDIDTHGLLRGLLRAYTAAIEAFCTTEGQLATRILVAELADRRALAWEIHLAAKVILACEQARDQANIDAEEAALYNTGFVSFEEVAFRLDARSWAADVLAAIPVVFGMVLPALHTDAGLELLRKFAVETFLEGGG